MLGLNTTDVCLAILGADLHGDNISVWQEASPEFHEDTRDTNQSARLIKFLLIAVVNPSLCIFGLLGNILNIVILSRGRMQETMSSAIERSSRAGLIGLAVSDMLCCASSLIVMMSGQEQALFVGGDPRPYVLQYGPYFQNACMKASTWLTVLLAVERYVAICRPIHARYMVDVRTTRAAICLMFLLTGTLELPTIWTFHVIHFMCDGSSQYHLLDHGPFVLNARLKTVFTYIWAVIGFLLPATILAYCNVHLVRALRESFRMGRLYRANFRSSSAVASNRLTLTLVSIVCMFLVLVTPSELLHLFYYAINGDQEKLVSLAIVVTNALQTANFAFNFVLYCIVNVQFRETWKEVLFCAVRRRKRSKSSAAGSGSGAIRTVQELSGPSRSQKNNLACMLELV